MKKKFYHALLSLLIAGLVLFLIYIIFAFFEGQYFSNKKLLPPVVIDNKVAQKLLVGDYVVFSTVTKTNNSYNFSLWRYLVGIDSLTNFYSIDFDQLEQKPQVNKFSAESLSVHFNNQHTLLHLNGDIIGPAESNIALISPNRNWLAYTDFSKSEQATIYLKSIVDNESVVVLNSGNDNINPSQDNFKILAWSNDSQILFIQNKNNLYQFFPEMLNISEVVSLTDLNTDNFFLQPKENIVTAISETNGISSLYLVNLKTEESLHVISNSAEKISNAIYNQTVNKITYTLGITNPQVWQVDISHPQVVDQRFLHHGKLLFWPETENLIIQQDKDIYLYSTKENNEQSIFTASNIQDLVEINFLDMFNIY